MSVGLAGAAHRVRVRPRSLTGSPLVSVVIPCFNYEKYVGAAIDSALEQPGVDVEVIVVDDCSADRSASIVRAFTGRDERVRLISHPENRGAVETFNTGLAEVRGEYIVRLDADDLLTPGALERAVAVAEAYPAVGLVYGHPLHFEGSTMPTPRLHPSRWTVWPGREWLRDRCATGVNVITSPEVVMRRAVVDVVGGQRPLAHTHDMEMWLRIAAVSDVAYVEGADQAWHREHSVSLSQGIDPRIGDILDRRDAFHTLFEWAGPYLNDAAEFRALADRALGDEAIDRIVHMYDRGKVDKMAADRLRALGEELTGEADTIDATLRRLQVRGEAAGPRPWQVARAVSRRIVNVARYRRWHRRGVFHRDGARGR